MAMRRLPLAWIAILPAVFGVGGACSSDETAPSVEDGGAPSAGEGGQAGSQPGSAGDAGSSSLPEGGSGEGGGAQGGMPPAGGVPAIGEAGSSAEAGGPPVAVGGAGGADSSGPPDLILSSGGPWPDSFSGSCASPSALIACPRIGDPFFGQDGTYRINVPSYTTTATTMTDSVTGLVWELDPEGVEKARAAAVSYCETLDLAGQTDWRLPSRLEYVTVLDEGLPNGFAMPPGVPVTTTGPHWTSSPTGTTAGASFVVHDGYGMWTVADDSTPMLARCVRGPTLGGSVQVGTDTAIDAMTELEWQRTNLDDSDRDWESALDHCETLEHGGKTDWRLPSIKELATIVDEAAAEALVVDSATFGDSQALRYWSSTPAISFGSERLALTLETNFGTSSSIKMTELSAARCVRTAD
jgi:hypothetical protein